MKKRLATLLRYLASKLSPEKNTDIHIHDGIMLPSPSGLTCYKVRRLAMAYRVSSNEEAEAHKAEHYGYPDAFNQMCDEYKKRIVHSIVAAIWERGLLEYNEERDPDTGELRISGSLYVGIRDDNENNNNNNQI